MCGIAGFWLSDTDLAKVDSNKLATKLLLEIEHRGRDATGAAWFDDNGTLMVQKDAMSARYFVPYLGMPEKARNVILHTRFGTKGPESNNDNNHPIVVNGVVGVHNGCISNDDELFKLMGVERIAQVDTEAAFAAIAYGTELHKDGQPRLANDLKGVLESIGGSAALAWVRTGEPNVLHLARVSGSPLVVASTKDGSLVFASTRSAIVAALKEVNLDYHKIVEPVTGTYVKLVDGDVVQEIDFQPWTWSSYSSKSTSSTSSTTYTSKGGTTSVVSSSPSKRDDDGADKTTPACVASSALQCAEAAIGGPKELTPASTERSVTTSNFEPFLPDVTLHLHTQHAFDYDIEPLDDDEYTDRYEHRELAIERWIETQEDVLSASHLGNALRQNGAFVKPGDLVLTDLPNNARVLGQVYLLPQSFPSGSYLIRALVPNKRYEYGFEPVLVSRVWGEFEVIESPDAEEAESVDPEEIDKLAGSLY